MSINLEDVLQAVGPNASLIFAAWIFLSFLQQRYSNSYERYRALISQYRESELKGQRQQSIREQILLYKKRCEKMKIVTNVGVVAAILLILSLISGALATIFSGVEWIGYIGSILSITGLLLVIYAASFVLIENSLVQEAIDSELADMPDLVELSKRGSS